MNKELKFVAIGGLWLDKFLLLFIIVRDLLGSFIVELVQLLSALTKLKSFCSLNQKVQNISIVVQDFLVLDINFLLFLQLGVLNDV